MIESFGITSIKTHIDLYTFLIILITYCGISNTTYLYSLKRYDVRDCAGALKYFGAFI